MTMSSAVSGRSSRRGELLGLGEEAFHLAVAALVGGGFALGVELEPVAVMGLVPGELVGEGGGVLLGEGDLVERGVEAGGVFAGGDGLLADAFGFAEPVGAFEGAGEDAEVDGAVGRESEGVLACFDGGGVAAQLGVGVGEIDPGDPVVRVGVGPELVGLDALFEIAFAFGVEVGADVELLAGFEAGGGCCAGAWGCCWAGSDAAAELEGLAVELGGEGELVEVVVVGGDGAEGHGELGVELDGALVEGEGLGFGAALGGEVVADGVAFEGFERGGGGLEDGDFVGFEGAEGLAEAGADVGGDGVEGGEDLFAGGGDGFGAGEDLAGGAGGGFEGEEVLAANGGDAAGEEDLTVAALAELAGNGGRDGRVGGAAHHVKQGDGFAVAEDVDVGGLLEVDLEGAFEGAVEGGVAGGVGEVGEDDLLEVGGGGGVEESPAGGELEGEEGDGEGSGGEEEAAEEGGAGGGFAGKTGEGAGAAGGVAVEGVGVGLFVGLLDDDVGALAHLGEDDFGGLEGFGGGGFEGFEGFRACELGGGGWLVGDGGGELVAAAGDGEDVVGAVAEGFADGEDVLGEIALFDEGVGPDGFEEVGFGDELAGVGDEAGEDFEGFGAERERSALTCESAGAEVQFEFAEVEDACGCQRHGWEWLAEDGYGFGAVRAWTAAAGPVPRWFAERRMLPSVGGSGSRCSS